MNTKKRDVKFIIYQALYIFVVCIVAIKGASLDLVEVENKMSVPGWTYIDTTNKVLIDRDELAKLIPFDSTNFLIVARKDYKNDLNNPPIQIGSTGPIGNNQQQDPPVVQPDPKKNVIDDGEKIDIISYASKLNLVQFTVQSINNPFNKEMIFAGKVIAPKSIVSIQLGGEGTQLMKVGNQTATVNIKQNTVPKIDISRIAGMDDNTRVTTLQKTTGFRVKIVDDFPAQLDIKFSGPITIKEKGNFNYDITMNAFQSKEAFDNYTQDKQTPYKVGFTVNVTDKIAGHKMSGQQSFVFGEW